MMSKIKFVDGKMDIKLDRKETARRCSVEVHTGRDSVTGNKLSSDEVARRSGFLSCNGMVEASKEKYQNKNNARKAGQITGSDKSSKNNKFYDPNLKKTVEYDKNFLKHLHSEYNRDGKRTDKQVVDAYHGHMRIKYGFKI